MFMLVGLHTSLQTLTPYWGYNDWGKTLWQIKRSIAEVGTFCNVRFRFIDNYTSHEPPAGGAVVGINNDLPPQYGAVWDRGRVGVPTREAKNKAVFRIHMLHEFMAHGFGLGHTWREYENGLRDICHGGYGHYHNHYSPNEAHWSINQFGKPVFSGVLKPPRYEMGNAMCPHAMAWESKRWRRVVNRFRNRLKRRKALIAQRKATTDPAERRKLTNKIRRMTERTKPDKQKIDAFLPVLRRVVNAYGDAHAKRYRWQGKNLLAAHPSQRLPYRWDGWVHGDLTDEFVDSWVDDYASELLEVEPEQSAMEHFEDDKQLIVSSAETCHLPAVGAGFIGSGVLEGDFAY